MTEVMIIDPPMVETIEHTALALVLDGASKDDWIATGRGLAVQKRRIDWMVGDWINHGREHFPEQIELALQDFPDSEKRIRKIEQTAKAFPAHLRSEKLSFDHHAHVADMPTQEALPLLKQAEAENQSAKELRLLAMCRKVDTGQLLAREDDPEDDAHLALVRAWNRAPISVREGFAELVAESDYGVIEP